MKEREREEKRRGVCVSVQPESWVVLLYPLREELENCREREREMGWAGSSGHTHTLTLITTRSTSLRESVF